MKARLTIESGDARPQSLQQEPTHAASLGRSRDNTVVLRSEHASRLHAKVLYEDGHWQVQDFSLNGTLVNGNRVQQRANLEHGQDIRIGEIRLRFTLDEVGPSTQSLRLTSTDRKEWSSGSMSTTRLHAADMSVLCAFMAAHVGCHEAPTLLREALALLLTQSGARATGYFSPDAADPLPKMVQPDGAVFEDNFSRHMTRRAQRDGKTIWLATEVGDSRPTDSTKEITDAICAPVRAGGAAIGMLHAVKKGDYFNERDVRFTEAMANFLAGCLRGLQERHNLATEVARLRSHPPIVDELIGDSAPMVQLRQQIALFGPRPMPALIRGEPGVGIDLVALALHRASPRVNGPFVAVPCSTIAPALLEGELFHSRPMSAGTNPDIGYSFRADGGTLFLDEVGDLAADAQMRLLRLIDDKCVRSPGSSTEAHADVRVICATQADLEEATVTNRFRRALWDRLGQAVIDVPPLRTHLEDVPYLVQYFLDKLAMECRREVTLTDAAMHKLQAYVWPGNHRQLRAEIEAAVLRTSRDVIDEQDVLIGCEKLLLAHV
jgi:transcriptional regulator with GAF, ATPase, and Fis domain